MQAFTRFDLLTSKHLPLMKSHKTSAFKENNKIKRTVPALDQKDLEEYGN